LSMVKGVREAVMVELRGRLGSWRYRRRCLIAGSWGRWDRMRSAKSETGEVVAESDRGRRMT
jgi:hypothetical protein